jgi:hypothetical protein
MCDIRCVLKSNNMALFFTYIYIMESKNICKCVLVFSTQCKTFYFILFLNNIKFTNSTKVHVFFDQLVLLPLQ